MCVAPPSGRARYLPPVTNGSEHESGRSVTARAGSPKTERATSYSLTSRVATRGWRRLTRFVLGRRASPALAAVLRCVQESFDRVRPVALLFRHLVVGVFVRTGAIHNVGRDFERETRPPRCVGPERHHDHALVSGHDLPDLHHAPSSRISWPSKAIMIEPTVSPYMQTEKTSPAWIPTDMSCLSAAITMKLAALSTHTSSRALLAG